MADRCRRIDYFYVEVPDQPGQGAQVLTKLKEAGVNLLSFTAFPTSGNKAQVDLVPENPDALIKVAKSAGLTLSPKKQALFVQGQDRIGAAAECFKKLADAKINVRAANACSSERGFGLILWVKPENFDAAAKALGAE
ncbi:MAG TPA: hypothetical protein VKE49_07900 [Myxococcaceae bacterium]|nr:hypothetical protein [Myxococcaceae bacterium]